MNWLQTLKYNYWLLFLLLLVSCSQNQVAKDIPLEDFFKNAQKSNFMISPDGTSISFLQPYKNKLNLFVMGVNGTNIKRITSETDRNIQHYFWADNEKILYTKDRIPKERSHLYSVKKTGSTPYDILPEGNFKIRLINPEHIINEELLLAMNIRDSTTFDAYRINLKTGKLSLTTQNPGNIKEWYADDEGQLRAAIASDGVNETLLYRESEKQPFKALLINNFKTTLKPVGFNRSDNCLFALSNQNRDKTALVEINTKTGKEHKVLYSHPEVDVKDAIYSYSRKQISSVIVETWKKERKYLDETVKKRYDYLESKLPNAEIKIVSMNNEVNKFIVKTFTDRNPGSYYLYDESKKEVKKLSNLNKGLEVDMMCAMKPIKYTSRDGLTINGYLTIPNNSNGKMLPVIVLPHGGPSSRTSWEFNPEVQFLASRGYAVFQVNYRGSTGYGKAFWTAGFKQWGNKIQHDITDGVKWLIDTKVADPKRIAIFGSNFGGYCALHGLCFESRLYRCGISFSGLTNLFTYLKGIPPYYKPYQKMFAEMVGNPETDADYLRAVSPVFHTDKIKVPLLIVQGAKDPRSCFSETNQFVKELKNKGLTVTYILKEEEGSLFKDQDNKMEFYKHLETFLQVNMKK